MRFKRLAGDPLAWVALIITPVALVILWDLSIEFFKIPSFLMPPPHEVWASIVQNRQALFVHGQVTLAETLIGFGLSVAIGIPIAMLIVSSRLLDRILNPILVASQAVPKVALAPLLLVLLGYGAAPKIIVALLIAFFPVVVNTASGLRAVNRDTIKLMRSMRASPWQIFRKSSLSDSRPAYAGRIQSRDRLRGRWSRCRRVRREQNRTGLSYALGNRKLRHSASFRLCHRADRLGDRVVLFDLPDGARAWTF